MQKVNVCWEVGARFFSELFHDVGKVLVLVVIE